MVEKWNIRAAYDAIAPDYAEERSLEGEDTRILETFLESIDPPACILDAGCGQGTPILERISRDHQAVGVDLSVTQLEIASQRVPAADLVLGDVAAVPFVPESFDAIIAMWSLIHIPSRDQPQVLEAFARMLKSGGRVLVCDGMHPWSGANEDWLGSGVEMQWDIAGGDVTQSQLEALGFSIVDRWEVPERLADDTIDDDPAWVFLEARLGD